MALPQREEEPSIRKTPGVCGGQACIRSTRIPVWLLAFYRRGGWSEERVLDNYPSLTQTDLAAAWEYEQQHPREIDRAIRQNQGQ
jgi:uncharacterized protein (DUF433 family)